LLVKATVASDLVSFVIPGLLTPSELTLFMFTLEPSFILYLLALMLQNANLLSDLTPVQVSFAIKSLATLVIRVDS